MRAGELGQLIQRGVVFAQDYSRALEQVLTGFSENHAARRAHKKPGAGFDFQLPDLHADRRLRDVYARGARSERARFGDGHKRS